MSTLRIRVHLVSMSRTLVGWPLKLKRQWDSICWLLYVKLTLGLDRAKSRLLYGDPMDTEQSESENGLSHAEWIRSLGNSNDE